MFSLPHPGMFSRLSDHNFAGVIGETINKHQLHNHKVMPEYHINIQSCIPHDPWKWQKLVDHLLVAIQLPWSDSLISIVGLSLGPQDAKGSPATCGMHRVNLPVKYEFDKCSSTNNVLTIHEICFIHLIRYRVVKAKVFSINVSVIRWSNRIQDIVSSSVPQL